MPIFKRRRTPTHGKCYHSPKWAQGSSPPRNNDYGDSSDSQSDHSQQNDVPRENPTVDDPSIKEQRKRTKSSSKGKSLVSRENPTVRDRSIKEEEKSTKSSSKDVPRKTATAHDRSLKEQEESTKSSSKGSRGSGSSIIKKVQKWFK